MLHLSVKSPQTNLNIAWHFDVSPRNIKLSVFL
jgi:hypothetical protein